VETGILTEIAKVEKEIEETIRQERLIAEKLIEDTKKKIEEDIRQKNEELDAKITKAISIVQHDAMTEGKRLIGKTEKKAQLLQNIDDKKLLTILTILIRQILPMREN